MQEKRTGGKRLHHRTHDVNTVKKEAEGKNGTPYIAQLFFPCQKRKDEAGEDDDVDIVAELKRNNLRCHGCADISTENNGNRLRQGHQAGTDKSDRHNGSGGGTLQNRCDKGAGQDAHNRISGKDAQHGFHFFPGRFLQALAHHVHTEKENGQSAQQTENNLYIFIHTKHLCRWLNYTIVPAYCTGCERSRLPEVCLRYVNSMSTALHFQTGFTGTKRSPFRRNEKRLPHDKRQSLKPPFRNLCPAWRNDWLQFLQFRYT